MRFAMAASLALTTLVLAGCIGDDEVADEPIVDEPMLLAANGPFDWGHTSCDAVIGVFPVEAAAVSPHLPDGFEVLPFKDALGVPLPMDPPGATGNFGVELLVCPDGVYGSYFAGVSTPDNLTRDVDLHFVKWDVAIADAALLDILMAAGVPAYSPEGNFMVFDGVETATVAGNGHLVMGETEQWLDAVGMLPNNDFPSGSFVEYTETPNGLVEWQAEFTFARSGLGLVNLEIGSEGLAADVFGAGPIEGAGFIGEMDLIGRVWLPAGEL